MALSPIHNHDLMTATGSRGVRPSLPEVGDTQAMGAEALGEGVERLQVGQRVTNRAQHTWPTPPTPSRSRKG
jgi:hypothetical protein